MLIKASELHKGVEVDMPVEWKQTPVRQRSIRYNPATQRYELFDIKTNEVHYSYSSLAMLVGHTNRIYEYDDEPFEDEPVPQALVV